MLDLNKNKYAVEKKFVFVFEMHKLLPGLKTQHDWLKNSPSQSLQAKCADLDTAFKSVKKSHFGFPRFKSKNRSRDSFRIPQTNNHIKISDKKISIPKIGAINWQYHRSISGVVKSITVSCDVDQWYVSVLCASADIDPASLVRDKAIGLDLGLTDFAITSDGQKYPSPKFLKKSSKRLIKKQRALSKKAKGSKNRNKARIRLARAHRQVRNQRANWLHQLSHSLVKKYDVICVEDLKTKDLMSRKKKTKNLSKAIADQGWGMFLNMIRYKSERAGKAFAQIDQYLASTKTCATCKEQRNMTLADRVHVCYNPKCADYLVEKDRDTNAANNILFWGLMLVDGSRFTTNTPGTGEINACGDTFVPDSQASWHQEVSAKQEAACPLGQR